jgi:hypothetical protein
VAAATLHQLGRERAGLVQGHQLTQDDEHASFKSVPSAGHAQPFVFGAKRVERRLRGQLRVDQHWVAIEVEEAA